MINRMLYQLRKKFVFRRYVDFQRKYLGDFWRSLYKKCSHLTHSRHPWTILCDYLIFWPLPKQQKFVIKLFKKLTGAARGVTGAINSPLFWLPEEFSTSILCMPRGDLTGLIVRNVLMFQPCVEFNHPAKDFCKFLLYYVIVRQIKDDITDVNSDSAVGKITPVTVFGFRYAERILNLSLKRVETMDVPLYYKNLLRFYLEV